MFLNARENLIMTPRAIGFSLFLIVATPAFAATGETTTPSSPNMSSPTLSYDGSELGPRSGLGVTGRTAEGPRTAASTDKSERVPSKASGPDADGGTNPSTNVGCGGAC
jgi:hypothetical protein